jgi:sugar-specific transcriptional regulator TrmB
MLAFDLREMYPPNLENMNTRILEEIGLTKSEIQVYIALLELGDTTAGPVIRRSGLYNSIVYTTLGSLSEKGFVTFVKRGQKRYYQASDPKFILQFLDKKKERIEALLPQLHAKQHPIDRQSAEVFSGFRGFKVMLYQFIEEARRGDEYLFFAFYTEDNDAHEEVHEFLKEYEKERHRRGIVVKGIVPEKARVKYEGRNLKNILFTDKPVLTNIGIFRDKVIMTPWEDGKNSFLVHSPQLAESFRAYFYSMWNLEG